MKFWELLESEDQAARAKMNQGHMEERVWDCDPLLVIDDSDDSIAFDGRTNVTVDPHPDGTADLLAEQNRDGWSPSLRNATVRASGGGGFFSGTRDGLWCRGADTEGNRFTWYINGAADAYGEQHMTLDDSKIVTTETDGVV
ncbi:MAG: hypothetical protein ACYC96_11970 [Fimbriimonadaceae bacterium]